MDAGQHGSGEDLNTTMHRGTLTAVGDHLPKDTDWTLAKGTDSAHGYHHRKLNSSALPLFSNIPAHLAWWIARCLEEITA
ncbi:hypothetical protein FKM82_001657 [Ascaphus truei]